MACFTIDLTDLEIEMYLGIHAHERRAMQRVIVSARIEVALDGPAPENYFDYDRVAEAVRAFAGRRIDTQEELVMSLHASIMAMPGAVRARVQSRKPDIYPDAAAVGVSFAGD